MKHYNKEDQKALALWAAGCVERVLHLYEETYPEDARPRHALEVLREWITTGDFSMPVIRGASLSAHAAAREAKANLPAYNAARAAGQAVATAHVAQHAFGVFYALRAIAASQPDQAEQRVREEYAWQAGHIPPHLKGEYEKRVVIQRRRRRLFISLNKDEDF